MDRSSKVPEGVDEIIDNSKIKVLTDTLLKSDVIIYDVATCIPKEVQFAIKSKFFVGIIVYVASAED